MTIHKTIKQLDVIATYKLDNNVTLLVFDGFAIGSDGKKYYHICKEDETGDLITVGWSCDIKNASIMK